LAYPETFELRRPVLECLPRLEWRRSQDGNHLELSRTLDTYSGHERALIEFALDPYYTQQNIFAGLDRPAAQVLAKAIYELFGPDGALAAR